HEPPKPETLANIVFGPLYRSVESESSESRFGMMINFDYDSAQIRAQSLPLLDSVGEMLKLDEAKGRALVIEGHADATGPSHYNLGLSERRAEAIKKYLMGSFDIPESQLVAIGMGESDPHNTEDPNAGINRRVVFKPVRSIIIE
ncbi:MAG: OmpA family protein, partial [Pseudomonadota bacterium]